MSSEINMIIDNLCQKLGTSATFLIPELAKKEIAECAVGLVFAVLVGVILVCVVKRISRRIEADDLDIDDAGFLYIFPGFALLADFIVISVYAGDLAGWIASPTAKAIEKIASMLK